ncbi:MAG: hypothetical protein A3A58_00200 [Candidatus Blackburnbacteria bacterium RIFCSPLOWO2_01_FULL_41_27]|uniref:Glycosyl transferase family 1 domain-containing protein n=2 Tax=Candidatus Blackburniibacteriota TaxID=1817898 RepID=A0A1G1VC94_9BACT|nr:MAG: hypothetical protein A3A58_00200 [Candidatus Blackburnbacteria bacterium RIFCSPLOWO2_01_FULL_41_27]OGY12907.1 MAG: hypothetical protein A3F61_00585 [Candidatus Blackburnbacteria bacterium RIFCSPHIGHO2_12_FULL_41_13b]
METKKRLKIAFLSFYSGIIERGVETLIPEIAERLGKNHEVVVYQSGPGYGKNYKIVQIPTSWKPDTLQEPLNLRRRLFLDKSSLAVMEFMRKILPTLKKEKFDVVVPWNNGWQTILCRFNNVGRVVSIGQSGLGWDDRVNLWLFPDYFVGFTKSQCEWANRVNPLVKTVTIPNGVDTIRFTPQGKKAKINLAAPIILCVAALVPLKRQKLAIKAVSLLKKGSLVLVGKGEMKDELQKMGDQLLPGRFKIFESAYKDIDKVYRMANVFTFPTSHWESFGLVLLEAMASGLPVVANDDPIRREIVGGGSGLFVNPEHAQEYAQALQKALATDWGVKPREQASKFSWDEIAKKYEQLFLKIV